MARNDATAAEQSFQEVLKINPRAAVASLQIARLRLARGETAGAVHAAEEASRERPDDIEAAVLLSRGLRAQGDVQRAQREIAARIARQPNAAALRLEMGWLSLQRGDRPAARASFDQALRLAPNSYDARAGLVTADVSEKKLDAARARIAEWRRAAPGDPRLRLLSARVELAAGKTADAERELRELVTADPSQLDAYDLLGASPWRTGSSIARSPSTRRWPTDRGHRPDALTLMGMIEEARGHRDAARAHYEQVLAADLAPASRPTTSPGYTPTTEGSTRRSSSPPSRRKKCGSGPRLRTRSAGCITGKGLASHAVAAFDRAVAKAPDNPVYHYHLGLAQLKAGNTRQGRAALTRALALKSDFKGADDARKALAQ